MVELNVIGRYVEWLFRQPMIYVLASGAKIKLYRIIHHIDHEGMNRFCFYKVKTKVPVTNEWTANDVILIMDETPC